MGFTVAAWLMIGGFFGTACGMLAVIHRPLR